MIKITLASSNKHKLEEINAINKNGEIIFEVVKDNFNPAETGNNFTENAIIKAKEAAKLTHSLCLADDSGLCVDILNGRPGIYSARYAPSQKEKIDKLLNELNGYNFNERQAHFTCSMVLVNENGEIIHCEEGKIFGYITNKPQGNNGFGYDPIFFVPELNQTIAELPENIKNKISHRANALIPMLKWISNNIKDI